MTENLMRLKIFVITPNIPRPDVNAGDRRLHAMLQMLATRHEVALCIVNNEGRGATADYRSDLERYRAALQNLDVRLIAFGWRHLEAALLATDYDVVFYEFYRVAASYQKLVEKRQSGIKSIVDTVDVHFARKQAGAALGVVADDEAQQTKRAELAVYNAADAVIAASDLDQALLMSENVQSKLYLIPDYRRGRAASFRARRDRGILFVGGFDHDPNSRWNPLVRGKHLAP